VFFLKLYSTNWE